jgi:hypothetical protein
MAREQARRGCSFSADERPSSGQLEGRELGPREFTLARALFMRSFGAPEEQPSFRLLSTRTAA